MIISVIVYSFLLIYVSVLGRLEYRIQVNDTASEKIKRILFWSIGGLPIVLFAGLRNVGIDYPTYIDMYERIKNNTLIEFMQGPGLKVEVSYYLLSRWSFLLFKSPYFLFIFYAALTVWISIAAIIKQGKKEYMAIALCAFMIFYYFESFCIMRQALAIGISLFVLVCLLKAEIKKALLFTMLSVFFHRSGFICFLYIFMYFFVRFRKTRYIDLFYTVFILSSPLWINVFFSLISGISVLRPYLTKYQTEFGRIGVGFILDFLFLLIPLIIYRKRFTKENINRMFYYIALLHVPLSFIGYYNEPLSRLRYYIIGSYVVIIPLFIDKFSGRNKKLITAYYVCALLFHFLHYYVLMRHNGVIPYGNILL